MFSVLTLAMLLGLFNSGSTTAPQSSIETILANNNRDPAGALGGGVLQLRLQAKVGNWYPDGPSGGAIPVEAFGEVGRPLQVPGPLIRVPLGTRVAVRIDNAIPAETLVVHGFVNRPTGNDRTIAIRPGETRAATFLASAPGTYYYWATTTNEGMLDREGRDSQLSGAIVVDDPRMKATARNDRIFVINRWDDVRNAKGQKLARYFILTINGRSWPATERLSYLQGATQHWRVINTSSEDHPLHLHGFYFQVDSRGDGLRDTIYPAGENRDRSVTELIPSGDTFTMSWTADRPGNWMFHCHLAYHIMEHAPIRSIMTGNPKWTRQMLENSGEMGGMVLAFTVRPSHPGELPAVGTVARHLRLSVEPLAESTAAVPAYQYVVAENGRADAGSGTDGPPIVLTRGVPVGIAVTNHLHEPTAVHWHGIELQDSYYDGVAGFSGYGSRRAPMIMPGQTFEARFAPPRAGTFIYHAHMNDVTQLRAGLSGALIVLAPGQRFAPATDHIVLITTPRKPAEQDKLLVNGSLAPAAMTWAAGVTQRVRLINMSTFAANSIVSLVSSKGTVQWVPIAKDGADLPAAKRVPTTAVQMLTIGETRDFAFVARPGTGDLRLEVRGFPGDPMVEAIPIHVPNDLTARAVNPLPLPQPAPTHPRQ
jgi:FtsP/CotA-like multicopper oxidase with cupredoxin domain